MITINSEKCTGCGRCQKVCPALIPVIGKGESPTLHHPEVCIECGHCVDVCPTGAYEHSSFPSESIHPIDRNVLPSAESLMELIRSRRSNRTITDAAIPEKSLNMIMEAARYAPTAQNSRQVHLTLITADEGLLAVETATINFFMRLSRFMLFPPVKVVLRPFLRKLYDEAPALMAMNEQFCQGKRPCICNCTALLVMSTPKAYSFGSQDSNLAYQNASLMAEALGVSQIYMGFVQTAMFMMGTKRAARILGIPKGHKPWAIMGLGMPAFKYSQYTTR